MKLYPLGPLCAVLMLFTLFAATSVIAQDSGMFIYPAKGRARKSKTKTATSAIRGPSSKLDSTRATPQTLTSNAPPPQPYQPSQPHISKGAGRGAALGAVGGAITGNAGKGAAAGAAMGGLAGGFKRRDEKLNQANQQQASVQSAQQNQRIAYQRAMAACVEGRGYTVK